jgi:hypothetical protein
MIRNQVNGNQEDQLQQALQRLSATLARLAEEE